MEYKHQLSRWLKPKSELDSVIKPLKKHHAGYAVKERMNECGKKVFAVFVAK